MWDSVKIFPFIEDALGYGPKLPSCEPKVGAYDTLNQSKFKDSQQPWPNDFCVNMPEPNILCPM